MTKLIVFVLLVVLGFCNLRTLSTETQLLKLKIGNTFTVSRSQSYELQCQGAQGQVTYYADGLPSCVMLKDQHIVVGDDCSPGRYLIRIKARDEGNSVDEKIISLHIIEARGAQTSTEGTTQTTATSTTRSTTSGASSQRLQNVISEYSTVTETTRTTYENNKFPEVSFPTGANTNIINTTPAQITTTRTTASESNRNTITSDDIAVRAASERHQNAIKAITNLLTIIDQARANRDYAKNQVQFYIKAYNEAIVGQRNTQSQIISIQTKRSQVLSAIEGIEGKIEELKREIKNIEDENAELQIRRSILLQEISAKEKMKATFMTELQKINNNLAQLMKQLTDQQEECEAIKAKISMAEAQLRSAQSKLASITQRRIEAELAITTKQRDVDRLRRELAAAEGALSSAKINLSAILEEEKRIPLQIKNLKEKIAQLNRQLFSCEAEVKRIQKMIDELDPNDLTVQIAQIEKSLLQDQNSLIKIDGAIAALLSPLENLKNQLVGAESDLQFLKAQIVNVQEELRQAYVRGNDANTLVAHARENMNAANQRYKQEENIITEATLNLERARAEEALARLALEEVIAYYSDALPYSIVPNGNGRTDAGTPSGNNPSGSPLGPIAQSNSRVEGSFRIYNWTHYLSSAFGAGVHPAFPGTVTQLYPFTFLSKIDGTYVENYNGACGGSGPVRAIHGQVVWIGGESFRIMEESGQVYEVAIEPCTKMNSNVEEYEMKAGDEAICKGAQKSSRTMSASQVTCLR